MTQWHLLEKPSATCHPCPHVLVGLLLVGPLGRGCNSLPILVVLVTLFGVVGRVGPAIVLTVLAELCGAHFLGDSLA